MSEKGEEQPAVQQEFVDKLTEQVALSLQTHPEWMQSLEHPVERTIDAASGENKVVVKGGEGEVASLVIPDGRKMNITGKYGPANEIFIYGTIADLNAARNTQEPSLEALTKVDIEKLNAPAPAESGAASGAGSAGGRRRTRRHNKKGDKKSRRQSKKGGKKHRKSAKTGSKKSKKSRRYSSRK
jgi:hypothetical protein